MGVRGRITSPGTVVGAAGPLNKAAAIHLVRREADATATLGGAIAGFGGEVAGAVDAETQRRLKRAQDREDRASNTAYFKAVEEASHISNAALGTRLDGATGVTEKASAQLQKVGHNFKELSPYAKQRATDMFERHASGLRDRYATHEYTQGEIMMERQRDAMIKLERENIKVFAHSDPHVYDSISAAVTVMREKDLTPLEKDLTELQMVSELLTEWIALVAEDDPGRADELRDHHRPYVDGENEPGLAPRSMRLLSDADLDLEERIEIKDTEAASLEYIAEQSARKDWDDPAKLNITKEKKAARDAYEDKEVGEEVANAVEAEIHDLIREQTRHRQRTEQEFIDSTAELLYEHRYDEAMKATGDLLPGSFRTEMRRKIRAEQNVPSPKNKNRGELDRILVLPDEEILKENIGDNPLLSFPQAQEAAKAQATARDRLQETADQIHGRDRAKKVRTAYGELGIPLDGTRAYDLGTPDGVMRKLFDDALDEELEIFKRNPKNGGRWPEEEELDDIIKGLMFEVHTVIPNAHFGIWDADFNRRRFERGSYSDYQDPVARSAATSMSDVLPSEREEAREGLLRVMRQRGEPGLPTNETVLTAVNKAREKVRTGGVVVADELDVQYQAINPGTPQRLIPPPQHERITATHGQVGEGAFIPPGTGKERGKK